MNSWLDNYAYRIPMTGWIFVAAVVMAVIVALGTISYQAIKAAKANPVKSLRAN